ncbi:bifunctional diguanylate cyclase/phosphodiesterase [Vibrio europaeus]|nr:bifunctional diguanylate cyclase/phosphodiesterase [Vibrio europaeus]
MPTSWRERDCEVWKSRPGPRHYWCLLWGHFHGDQILKIVTARLTSLFEPEPHVLARIGGDEFAIYLQRPQSPEQSLLATNRVVQQFASPICVENETTLLHVSVGVATLSEGDAMSDWLQKGSIALSHAKSHPTKICHYQRDMDAVSRHKTTLLPQIKAALENHEFVPYYQPLVALDTQEVIGAEALARWISPERGVISPLEFIPIAEEYGLINEIGFGILEQACADTVRGIDEGKFAPHFHLHVNLSVQQLVQPGCVDAIKRILERTGLEPTRLTLEITESKLVDSDQQTTKNMRAIRHLGIGIAIDDFGTGYSSLAYLYTLPYDCLKIDRIFVDRMALDDDTPSLVKTIIDLTSTLQHELVAEGIETQAQADKLACLGCPIGQGFLFSPPVAYDDWEASAFVGLSGDLDEKSNV